MRCISNRLWQMESGIRFCVHPYKLAVACSTLKISKYKQGWALLLVLLHLHVNCIEGACWKQQESQPQNSIAEKSFAGAQSVDCQAMSFDPVLEVTKRFPLCDREHGKAAYNRTYCSWTMCPNPNKSSTYDDKFLLWWRQLFDRQK